jgi:NAD(P)-dependent dehydrogenase (short-subunit alcohol dehydrogenase family)
MQAAPALAPLPPLLPGRRVVVLGSGGGLGRAVALTAEAAGAEVLGVDEARVFDGLAALYRADLADPAALDAAAAALPEGIAALALFPDPGAGDAASVLARALVAPRRLAEALAPKLAPGAAIVARGAPPHAAWHEALAETRAAAALRWEDVAGFVTRWRLDAEPARAVRTAGWGMLAWVAARRWTWAARGVRVNALTPAAPDGRLPPEVAAARGVEAGRGTEDAARAALFLMSDLSVGLTGANVAADGGLSARISAQLDGL